MAGSDSSNSLEGKVIVVAGGGNGSGRACALAYAAAGAKIAVADINASAAEEVRAIVSDQGGVASVFTYDNDKPQTAKAMVEQVLAEFGRIDGLHAIAGNPTLHMHDLDLLSSEPDIWNKAFRSHFIAPAEAAKATIPSMIANGGGSIILTSSGQAIAADTTRLGYQVSKRAVEILALHIARTYGRQGIRSNCLRYGLLLTDNAKKHLSEDFIADAKARTWLGRLGQPQDVEGVALFLMSDTAAFISGQIIEVAGGKMAGVQG